MYDVINYILFNFNKRLFSYNFLFNILLCIKSEQKVIGNWFRAPILIIFKKKLKTGFSKRTLLLQFVSGVIFLIRITGFYGLFKVSGIQKYYTRYNFVIYFSGFDQKKSKICLEIFYLFRTEFSSKIGAFTTGSNTIFNLGLLRNIDS